MMRAAAGVALLLLLPLLLPGRADAAAIRRTIVPDLTVVLREQLEKAHISLLLVLPGPQPVGAMKLQLGNLTADNSHGAGAGAALERVDVVTDYTDFLASWHGAYRTHTWRATQQQAQQQPDHQQHTANEAGPRRPSTDSSLHMAVIDSTVPLPEDDGHPLHAPDPPRVALLVRGEGGALRAATANLAAAITRRLRHAHLVTLQYSTHADKSDSLLTFAFDGEPLAAHFAATAIFRDAFSSIYKEKVWGSGGGGSGDGSTVQYTTRIRAALPDIIRRYNINSLLDSSCGSLHWMPLVLAQLEAARPGFRFMGTDVVCSLIARHQAQLAPNHTNWGFACVDYANQPLPSGYDLVWSRDSLQHVPMHAAWQFLNNVKASGARYLLVGSYIRSPGANLNIKAGEYYSIDLTKPPFNLSRPLEVIDEQTPDGKFMLLYDVGRMTWDDPLDGLV